MTYTAEQQSYIKQSLNPIREAEYVRDMLDDSFDPVIICGLEYAAGTALERIDPIAFRCAVSDQLDAECSEGTLVEIDGEYYDAGDVEALFQTA